MNPDSVYYRQVKLLVGVLPFIDREPCFALRGGTAINLFIRDLPRLSVDIDLTYLPVKDRDKSLAEIHAALRRIAEAVGRSRPEFRVDLQRDTPTPARIFVTGDGAQVKVEANPVFRGVVGAPKQRDVGPRVEQEFGFAKASVVSMADLYGGKIAAALDRQHPRDLFDVMLLLRNEGITREIFEGFLVYLIGHNRPMAELLNPREPDLRRHYEGEFAGLTSEPVSLAELITAPIDVRLSLGTRQKRVTYRLRTTRLPANPGIFAPVA